MNHSHHFKRASQAIAIVTFLFLSAGFDIHKTHATAMPVCPFTPAAGRIIVHLSGTDSDRIVSDTVNYPDYPYKTIAYPADIPPGSYNVTLFGGDAGIDRAHIVTEPNERWFAILNSNGTEIARTNSTDDLQDGVNSVGAQKLVNTNLTLIQHVDSIIGYHSNYPDTTNANSVVPICAQFDEIIPVIPPVQTPQVATLTLTKIVVNDNGGTKAVSDFPLFAGTVQMTSGSSTTLTPGTYSVHETNSAGYTASGWTGDCTTDGSVTLVAGDHKACSITNNDNAPAATTTPVTPAATTTTLTVIKNVINDNGGTLQVANFPLFIGSTQVTSGVAQNLNPGVFTVHEISNGNYTASQWGGDCAADGTVTLNAGDHKTCSITNNDNPQQVQQAVTTGGGGSYTPAVTPTVLGVSTGPLACYPQSQNGMIGQPITWSASGGDGNYEWFPTDSNLHGVGPNFTTTYSSGGTKNVILKSTGQIAVCGVTIPEVLDIATPGLPNTGVGDEWIFYALLALLPIAATTTVLAAIKRKYA